MVPLRFFPLATLLLCAPLACPAEDDALTRIEFCEAWASRACNSEVVSICQASSAEACQEAQSAFCGSVVPAAFTADAADKCLDAVANAYADADLTRDELDTVLTLGPPCDELAKGSTPSEGACGSDVDCEAASGYRCVIKGGETVGTCQVPEEVEPGLRCDAPEQVCTEGFFCNNDNCVQTLEVGEGCVNHAECGASGFCSEELCRERFALNAECSFHEQCNSGICYEGSVTACADRVRLSPAEPLCQQLR
jgi:hypothetical protein